MKRTVVLLLTLVLLTAALAGCGRTQEGDVYVCGQPEAAVSPFS